MKKTNQQSAAIKALCRLAMRTKMVHYPNTPERFIPSPKYSDRTANGLTKCIIHFLNFNGWQAERINSTGRIIDNRTQSTLGHIIGGTKWIKSSGQVGTADISATIKGRSIKIEVKCEATGDRCQSEGQKLYQKKVEQAGGVYVIARTFDGFYDWYNKHITPPGHE